MAINIDELSRLDNPAAWRSLKTFARTVKEVLEADNTTITGPLTINNGDNAPSIQITQSPDAAPNMPAITVTTPPGASGFTTPLIEQVEPGPVGPRTTHTGTQPGGGTGAGNIRSRVTLFTASERHDFSGTIVSGGGANYVIHLRDFLREPLAIGDSYTINAPEVISAVMQEAADDAVWPPDTFCPVVTRLRTVRVTRRTAFDSGGNIISVYDTRLVLGPESWIFQLPVWL